MYYLRILIYVLFNINKILIFLVIGKFRIILYLEIFMIKRK